MLTSRRLHQLAFCSLAILWLATTPPRGEAQRPGGQIHPPNEPSALSSDIPELRYERVVATLLKLSTADLTVQTEDRRYLKMRLDAALHYSARTEGGHSAIVKPSTFEPGDAVTIDSMRDENGLYTAWSVHLDREPSAAEKSAAAASLNQLTGSDSGRSPVPAGDPVITAARAATARFVKTLPNFIVRQFTTRFVAPEWQGDKKRPAPPSNSREWRRSDAIAADLITENGHEAFRNILLNRKPALESKLMNGLWSTGEFSTTATEVLSPATVFGEKRRDAIGGRSAWRSDFFVAQTDSHWRLVARGQIYIPAFGGAIWIDEETSRILRIESATRDIPRTFTIEHAISNVEYAFLPLGETIHLLPVRAETITCMHDGLGCARNAIEFRGYRKFEAESSISFDKDPP